jgi:signal transduction histidine kinase
MRETPSSPVEQTPLYYSLSAKMLLLILSLLVTLSSVLIHIPFVADYREAYLKNRIVDAYIATLILQAEGVQHLDKGLEKKLLKQVQVLGIELRYQPPPVVVSIGKAPTPDAIFDLREQMYYQLLREALVTLLVKGRRIIQLIDNPPRETGMEISVFMDERQLYEELYSYSLHVLERLGLISLITAVLLYLSLQWLIVRSIYRITRNLAAFREDPQNPACILKPSQRRDEMGVLERELARMQSTLRTALAQQSRLAAVGKAVSRINHDMKSILSTVSIASERLAKADDPAIRKIARLLVGSVEKAVDLCTQTQDLARGEQAVPQRTRLRLHDLIDEVGAALGLDCQEGIQWRNEVKETLEIDADAERLYRVFMNLLRNSAEALAGDGTIRITAQRTGNTVAIDVMDTGPGIPEQIRTHLFEPFTGSARPGGIGLGLATARDLVRAHRGELTLAETGPEVTRFHIELPA